MPQRTSRSSATPVLIVGAILVLALIGVSLSRTLRSPQPAPNATTAVQTPVAAQPSPSSASPLPAPVPQSQDTASTSALPPLVPPRGATAAPITAPPFAEPEPQGAVLAAVPRTAPEELFRRLENKSVTILDVRDADSYLARHIPGSMHIPLARIDGEVPYLPRDKPIVAYCT